MYRFSELCNKEVINIRDGCKIGCVSDVEIDTSCGTVHALIVSGQFKMFGLIGSDEECVIEWKCVERVSKDVILVCIERKVMQKRKRGKLF